MWLTKDHFGKTIVDDASDGEDERRMSESEAADGWTDGRTDGRLLTHAYSRLWGAAVCLLINSLLINSSLMLTHKCCLSEQTFTGWQPSCGWIGLSSLSNALALIGPEKRGKAKG